MYNKMNAFLQLVNSNGNGIMKYDT